jgi:hypothetical protein
MSSNSSSTCQAHIGQRDARLALGPRFRDLDRLERPFLAIRDMRESGPGYGTHTQHQFPMRRRTLRAAESAQEPQHPIAALTVSPGLLSALLLGRPVNGFIACAEGFEPVGFHGSGSLWVVGSAA